MFNLLNKPNQKHIIDMSILQKHCFRTVKSKQLDSAAVFLQSVWTLMRFVELEI